MRVGTKPTLHVWDASHIIEAFFADSQGMKRTGKLHAKQLIYNAKCMVYTSWDSENVEYIDGMCSL